MRKSQIGRPKVSIGTIVALIIAAPVLGVTLGAAPAHAQVSLDIRIGYAPPPLPYYEQPPLPGPDYIWVPGTWAWSDYIDDYYWVSGYWDMPPEQGLMWTPAWWGWDYGAYRFNQGYWGQEVGWYGGIDYGHGYHGHGWDGGHWDNGHVAYNRAVINVTNVNVTNVYYAPVSVNSTTVNRGPRVSYNGGAGGVTAQPRPEEMRVMNAPHIAPTQAQQQHVQQAAANPRAAASQITPTWNPPAVHRVGNDGTPIPRAAALAHGGVGVPRQNQQQQQRNPNTPSAMAPRQYQAAPANGQAQTHNGQAPRQMQQPPAQGYSHAAPQTHTPSPQGQYAPNYGRAAPQQYSPSPQGQYAPNYGRAAPPQYTPPQPRTPPQTHYQQQSQPAPNYGRAAPPQPQFHAVAPPPSPRPAPPPPPRPQPQPQPPHNDKDHRDHQ